MWPDPRQLPRPTPQLRVQAAGGHCSGSFNLRDVAELLGSAGTTSASEEGARSEELHDMAEQIALHAVSVLQGAPQVHPAPVRLACPSPAQPAQPDGLQAGLSTHGAVTEELLAVQ